MLRPTFPLYPRGEHMPVIYIKKEHYDALIRKGETPKKVVDKLLIEYLKDEK